MSKRRTRSSRISTAVGVCALVVVSLVAAGCGSGDRQAAHFGNLGSRVCIKNQSSVLLVVNFTAKDTSTGEGQVTPGAQVCAERTSFIGTDVAGTIGLPPPLANKTFKASAPWAGWPNAGVYEDGMECLYMAVAEGRVNTHDDGVLLYRLQRLPDDEWKEWVITIERSQQPSPSGMPTKCWMK